MIHFPSQTSDLTQIFSAPQYRDIRCGSSLEQTQPNPHHTCPERWNQISATTKKQIAIWQHWKQETEDNDRPLSEVEAERMKRSSVEMFPRYSQKRTLIGSRTFMALM
jgi:hypothetical protein